MSVCAHRQIFGPLRRKWIDVLRRHLPHPPTFPAPARAPCQHCPRSFLLHLLIALRLFVLFAFECWSHSQPFFAIHSQPAPQVYTYHSVLPPDRRVYSSSRSPPVEDGDASRRLAWLGAAVGITAATSPSRKLAEEKQEGREQQRGRAVNAKQTQSLKSFHIVYAIL